MDILILPIVLCLSALAPLQGITAVDFPLHLLLSSTISAEILIPLKPYHKPSNRIITSFLAWKISDKQPGDPYIWYSGYLNLESYDVKQFRFNLRLRDPCQKHCGYVAFDEITLQCEAEEDTLLPLETCEKRLTALPGCGIDVLQPLYEGKPTERLAKFPSLNERRCRIDILFSFHIL